MKIRIEKATEHGVTFSRGEGDRKESVEVEWTTVFNLAGTSGGFGGPNYPQMMPRGPFADLAIEAMKSAREIKTRILIISKHPHNQVRVETVAGEYVGQEMGVDWAHTQHAFPAQAENEASELRSIYEKKGFRIIRR